MDFALAAKVKTMVTFNLHTIFLLKSNFNWIFHLHDIKILPDSNKLITSITHSCCKTSRMLFCCAPVTTGKLSDLVLFDRRVDQLFFVFTYGEKYNAQEFTWDNFWLCNNIQVNWWCASTVQGSKWTTSVQKGNFPLPLILTGQLK